MKKIAKILKNYRFSEDTVKQLEELQVESGKTATELVEAAVNYVYEEMTRALSGRDHDRLLIAQVLGKRIDKVS